MHRHELKQIFLCSEDDDVICLEHSPVHVPALRNHTSSDRGTKRTVTSERDYEQKKKHRTKDRAKDRATSNYHSHKSGPPASCWLAPNLRVRIISKDYCEGAYYNNKVSSCLACVPSLMAQPTGKYR